MPKAIKKKVSKRVSGTETKVKDTLTSLQDTVQRQKKTMVMYGSIIMAIIIAVAGLFIYDYSSKKKARMLGYQAYKIYYNIYQKQPGDREAQFTKALEGFKKSYDTRKSPTVLFYIANCYYELGKYDEALKTLKDFTERYSKDEMFIPLVYQKMVIVYEKKGETNEAIKVLEAFYKLKGDIYKDFALMEYARLLEKEGKKEEAQEKYKELSERFPNSPFSSEAKTKLSAEEKKG